MTTVTVSPKYQVVIPQQVREALGIRPEFIPVVKPKKMRGYLRGIDTAVPRDKDRV